MGKIVIKSDEQRLVFAEVYAPNYVDTQGEVMTKGTIEKMAHKFLSSGRTNKIDCNHNYEETGSVVVESYIAKQNDPDGFIEGAWVVGVKVDPKSWEAIKKGELNGFSFAGRASSYKTEAIVTHQVMLSGETEKGGDESHTHKVVIRFDDNDKVIPTYTDYSSDGHRHEIKSTTATNEAAGHSHRLLLIEG